MSHRRASDGSWWVTDGGREVTDSSGRATDTVMMRMLRVAMGMFVRFVAPHPV